MLQVAICLPAGPIPVNLHRWLNPCRSLIKDACLDPSFTTVSSQLNLLAMAPHTNCWTNDEPNGTLFHEIITLPTLASHLANAEHLVPYMTQSTVPPLQALTPNVPNATPPQVSRNWC